MTILYKIPISIFVVFISFFYSPKAFCTENKIPLRGINLAGAEFGSKHIPGIHNHNYHFPTKKDVEMFADFGMQIIRLPLKWQRLQHILYADLDKEQLAYVNIIINEAQKHNIKVIIDVHNYGTYNNNIIGSKAVPLSAFKDLWAKLAVYYKNQKNVIFGIMNEPHKHTAEEWAQIAQETITAIRKTGASQMILISGTYYSAAHKWSKKYGKLSNAQALKNINDPINKFAFEVHLYFDKDSSGTHDSCVSENIGVKRLTEFTKWLRETGNNGFLGEFGVSRNAVCLLALDNILAHMDQNKDVWYGWTYWAASEWFGKYMFNVYPPDTITNPQAAILKKYVDAQ